MWIDWCHTFDSQYLRERALEASCNDSPARPWRLSHLYFLFITPVPNKYINLNQRQSKKQMQVWEDGPCRLSHLHFPLYYTFFFERAVSCHHAKKTLWQYKQQYKGLWQNREGGRYLLRLRRKCNSSFDMAGPRFPSLVEVVEGTWS